MRFNISDRWKATQPKPAQEADTAPQKSEANKFYEELVASKPKLIDEKVKHGAPDIVLRPNVGVFRALDFLRASAILRAAEPVKAELREKLSRLLAS